MKKSCLIFHLLCFFVQDCWHHRSIFGLQSTPPWPSSYWDIPGDYCRAKYPEGRCCLGRKDPCSVPILGKNPSSQLLNNLSIPKLLL